MSAMHQPGFQKHRRVRSLGGSSSIARTDRDEDLALFHEMQERELAQVFSSTTQTDPSSLMESQNKVVTEDIFSSTEWDKNDYGWLLPAPSTPFIPSRAQEAVENGYSLNGTASAKSLLKTSRIGISRSEPSSRAEPVSRTVRGSLYANQPAHSMAAAALSSSTNGPRKALSSSTDAALRSSTPTSNGRPSTPKSQTAARPSTPTRGTSSSALGSLAKSVRPSTPTGRSAMVSAARVPSSSGPSIVRSASISAPMQPTRAPTASAPSRPGGSSSRASTPVKRPTTPTRTANLPTTTANRRSASPQPKSAATPRPSSPAGKLRQQPADHPAVLPGFSEAPPPNLRTSISERPLSNSRGSIASRASGPRPTQPAETNDATRRLRPSGSPVVTRGRLSSDSINSEKSVSRGKPHDAALQTALANGIQSKMIDRTASAKKSLVVPDKLSAAAISQVKKPVKSSPLREMKSTTPSVRESTGFGRNLSKKSLDMALRHMDIGKAGPTSFKSFMLNMPTSSLYSVRSSNGRGRSNSSIADSPMATSSNASSEHSMNFPMDRECSEGGDELLSERGSKASSTSQPDSYDEKKVNSWLGSPRPNHSLESNADILQAFEQGIENLSTSESPLVSHCEGRMERNNFALEPVE